MKSQWIPPLWWNPLLRLNGYRNLRYQRAQMVIEEVCLEAKVEPDAVVRLFANYWPTGRYLHGWIDPVKALIRTLPVQIAKTKKEGSHGEPGEHSPARSRTAKLQKFARQIEAEAAGGRGNP